MQNSAPDTPTTVMPGQPCNETPV